MLVLSRKRKEKIIIRDDIVVVILSISEDGESVRLGITAPKEVKIHRLNPEVVREDKSRGN